MKRHNDQDPRGETFSAGQQTEVGHINHTNANKGVKRVLQGLITLAAALAVTAAAYGLATGKSIPWSRGPDPKIPRAIINEDFQRAIDAELTRCFQSGESWAISEWVDDRVLKPVIDDTKNLHLSLNAVEVTPGQFPDHPELWSAVEDCARILGIPRPRVFVVGIHDSRFVTTNVEEPTILVPASALSRYTTAAEWRFLLGREMGHIRCSHVKWLMVTRVLNDVTAPRGNNILLAPILKWAREAEMSADNAGLICAQDLKIAEIALVKQMLNVNALMVGQLNVDSVVNQRQNLGEVSVVARGFQFLERIVRDQPYAADRIDQLRTYAASPSYQTLWEN